MNQQKTGKSSGAGKRESEIEKSVRGWRRERWSWFHRLGKAYRKTQWVIRNENDVGGRAKVTGKVKRCEEAEQWRGYGHTKVWCFVRTLYVTGKSLHSMRPVILSHWTERGTRVVWQDFGALTTARERMFRICWMHVVWDLGRL